MVKPLHQYSVNQDTDLQNNFMNLRPNYNNFQASAVTEELLLPSTQEMSYLSYKHHLFSSRNWKKYRPNPREIFYFSPRRCQGIHRSKPQAGGRTEEHLMVNRGEPCES